MLDYLGYKNYFYRNVLLDRVVHNTTLIISTIKKLVMKADLINPFLADGPILYLLKTPKNQCFVGVFRVYKMQTLELCKITRKNEQIFIDILLISNHS